VKSENIKNEESVKTIKIRNLSVRLNLDYVNDIPNCIRQMFMINRLGASQHFSEQGSG
jgi:hypothetical protein